MISWCRQLFAAPSDRSANRLSNHLYVYIFVSAARMPNRNGELRQKAAPPEKVSITLISFSLIHPLIFFLNIYRDPPRFIHLRQCRGFCGVDGCSSGTSGFAFIRYGRFHIRYGRLLIRHRRLVIRFWRLFIRFTASSGLDGFLSGFFDVSVSLMTQFLPRLIA